MRTWTQGKRYRNVYEVGPDFWDAVLASDFRGSSFRVVMEGTRCEDLCHLEGTVLGDFQTFCHRCMDPITVPLRDHFPLCVQLDVRAAHSEAVECGEYVFAPQATLDLRAWIRDSILLATAKPVHCAQASQKACNAHALSTVLFM